MKINKKSITISAIIVGIVFIVIPAILKIYFIILIPEARLKTVINTFFNDYLGRAIKFEEVSIDFLGNIHVEQFNLSTTSDFNDNLSMISSEELVIKLQFFNAISHSVVVKSLHFNDNTILLVQKYKDYYIKTYNNILALNKKKMYKTLFNSGNIEIYINNALVKYKNQLKEKKIQVLFDSIDAELDVTTKMAYYKLNGDIKSYNSKFISDGDISIAGEFKRLASHQSETKKTKKSSDKKKNKLIKKTEKKSESLQKRKIKIEDTNKLSFKINNFDISYLNNLLKKYVGFKHAMFGAISISGELKQNKKNSNVVLDIETNNLNLFSYGNQPFKIIANEELNLELKCNINNDFTTVKILPSKLYDDAFKILFNGSYAKTTKDEIFKLSVKSNEINLEEVNSVFTPFNNFTYEGSLLTNIDFVYNIKKDKLEKSKTTIKIKDFSLKQFVKGRYKEHLTKSSMQITSKKDMLQFAGKLLNSNNELNFSGKSHLMKLDSLKTKSELQIDAKKIDGNVLYKTIRFEIANLFDDAYIDSKKGYERIYFPTTTVGRFVNNNEFKIKIKSSNVGLQNKANLTGFNLDLSLKKGLLRTKNFRLTGYEGVYKFLIYGFFQRDMGFFQVKGSAENVDVAGLYSDMKLPGTMSGKFSFDFDYEVVAARIAHLFENAKLTANVSLKDSVLTKTGFIKDINRFLTKNKKSSISDILNVKNAGFTLTQSQNYFYIKNMNVSSDNLNFNAYGHYKYGKGWKIPLYIRFTDINKKFDSFATNVKGDFSRPCVFKKKSKKNPSPYPLCFHPN